MINLRQMKKRFLRRYFKTDIMLHLSTRIVRCNAITAAIAVPFFRLYVKKMIFRAIGY